MHEIIKEVAAGAEASGDPFAALTGSFYSTGMNADKINSMGFDPVNEGDNIYLPKKDHASIW